LHSNGNIKNNNKISHESRILNEYEPTLSINNIKIPFEDNWIEVNSKVNSKVNSSKY